MNRSRRSILKAATLAISAGALAGAEQSPSPQEQSAMEEVATAFLKEHSIAGLSVAVARHGELVYEQGYGFADRDRHEKVTPSHLFRIASVSKPITSVAIFQLVEQGRLKLDDPVFGPGGVLHGDFGKPPYATHVGEIRIHHLLTHTAGGWKNDGRDPMFQHPQMDHRQLITWALAEEPLLNRPGENYAYSNFGYCILGRVVEKLTGKPYERHIQEAVLKPCGVTGMRIGGNTLADRAPGEVVYYGAGGQNPYNMNVRRMDSHGGWLAKASDLVRFANHVDGFSTERNMLRPESIKEMTTATTANAHYAKGWQVNEIPNWWHGGSLPGTSTIMVRTGSGLCWAGLTNGREVPGDTGLALDRLMWNLARQVKGWKA